MFCHLFYADWNRHNQNQSYYYPERHQNYYRRPHVVPLRPSERGIQSHALLSNVAQKPESMAYLVFALTLDAPKSRLSYLTTTVGRSKTTIVINTALGL